MGLQQTRADWSSPSRGEHCKRTTSPYTPCHSGYAFSIGHDVIGLHCITHHISHVVQSQGESIDMGIGVVLVYVHLVGEPSNVLLYLLLLRQVLLAMVTLPAGPLLNKLKLWADARSLCRQKDTEQKYTIQGGHGETEKQVSVCCTVLVATEQGTNLPASLL